MTLSTFRRLYLDYQDSGLNVRDFCANQCFAPSTFYYWKKKLEDTPQYQPDCFVPLVFDSNQSAANRQTVPAPITSAVASDNHTPIEFVFPNGTKMLFRDNINIGLLKTIVHLFD